VPEWPDDQNDWWMRHANLTEEQRLLLRRRANGHRIAFSLILITAGVLLFLGNLGIFPIHNIWVFWPLIPIAFGISRLIGGVTRGARSSGIWLILFGAFFLLSNLGWLDLHAAGGSWPFSLLLIGVGVAALFNGLDFSRRPGWGAHFAPARPRTAPDYENAIHDFVLFGALKRKLETPDFRGGEITTIFASIEMDLRRAFITQRERSAVINVMTVFGETKLRVPENWRVIVSGTGILGNFEDKTIPPNTGPDAPTLIIAGFSIFGAVQIED
jgi:cell wall-active antibiotic response 4TMS protein YvqF